MTLVLTPIQIETARIVRDYVAKHGCGPTLKEIAAVRGCTPVTVFEAVHSLLRKGVLVNVVGPRKVRGLRYDPGSRALPDDGRQTPRPTEAVADEIVMRLHEVGPGEMGIGWERVREIVLEVLERGGG